MGEDSAEGWGKVVKMTESVWYLFGMVGNIELVVEKLISSAEHKEFHSDIRQ